MSVLASPLGIDPLIAEAKRRARRRLLALGAIAAAAAALAAWNLAPGGGDSFVMGSRGPVTHLTGYVSTASALSRAGISFVGSSGGVTRATRSDGTTWLTTNGGRTWRRANAHGGYGWNIQFVDTRHGWAIARCGVERTTDGGRTWQCSGPVACRDRCDFPSISFLDARRGFLLAGRLFRTGDGGRTWQPVSKPVGFFGPIRFVNARLGFAGDSGGLQPDFYNGPWIEHLYRTTDGGVTWSKYDVGGTSSFVEEPMGIFGRRLVLAQNAPNPPTTGTSVNENLGAVWVTADAGAHWLGRPVPLVNPDGIFPSALSIASPHELVVAHGAELYEASDGGAGWRDISLRGLPTNAEISQLAFTSSRVGWAVIYLRGGIDGTLFRTTDGGLHWTAAGPREPKPHHHR